MEEVVRIERGSCSRKRNMKRFFFQKPERKQEDTEKESGGDALRGNTRSHSEHDG